MFDSEASVSLAETIMSDAIQDAVDALTEADEQLGPVSRQREYLDAAMRIGKMALWILDVSTGMVTRSANANELLGSRREHISNFVARVIPEDGSRVDWEAGAAPEPPPSGVEFRYQHPDGRLLWLRSIAIKLPGADESKQIVGITTDVTDQKTFELQLAQAAHYDPLTGLSNRRFFAERLDAELAASAEDAAAFAVLLVDLDQFKPVNDVYGHGAGDEVLCTIADRLKGLGERDATVARLGGDEFALLARLPRDARSRHETIVALADQIVRSVREPVVVAGVMVEVGASVGVALYPSDGDSAETLLRAADLAMYRAKDEGRNTFRFFEQRMDDALRARAMLESDLRAAIAGGDIKPYYQPLMGLDGETIYGFEVLARWNDAQRGFVPPDDFIPLTEHIGLIDDLTTSIVRQACRDTRDWGNHIRIAINISPAQFQDQSFPERLMAILLSEGFPPSRLELEVTESALVGDLAAAKATLNALKGLGIKIALDDFGIGYSSLYHLREFNFDKIKIDRSFVQSMGKNAESEKIVDAVLALASSLGMPAVAEGIEDRQTMEGLAARGCAFGQGYFFSKALPADRAEFWVELNRVHCAAA